MAATAGYCAGSDVHERHREPGEVRSPTVGAADPHLAVDSRPLLDRRRRSCRSIARPSGPQRPRDGGQRGDLVDHPVQGVERHDGVELRDEWQVPAGRPRRSRPGISGGRATGPPADHRGEASTPTTRVAGSRGRAIHRVNDPQRRRTTSSIRRRPGTRAATSRAGARWRWSPRILPYPSCPATIRFSSCARWPRLLPDSDDLRLPRVTATDGSGRPRRRTVGSAAGHSIGHVPPSPLG